MSDEKKKYINIPVDEETYQMLLVLCAANDRKQGAQVKQLVKVDYEKLKEEEDPKKVEPVKKSPR